MLNKLGAGSIVPLVVSNRDLETFGLDGSGEQALKLLLSEALASFQEKSGDDVPTLVEGRVGIVATITPTLSKIDTSTYKVTNILTSFDSLLSQNIQAGPLQRVSWGASSPQKTKKTTRQTLKTISAKGAPQTSS